MQLRICLILLAGLASAWAQAAPALSPVLQARLDRAVLAYEAGRLVPAHRAFDALARQHVPAAEYNLAVMHLRKEVPRADSALARRLLERAARRGFVIAQLTLAQALENGQLGPRNLLQAHHWYALAAAAGNVEAQLAMGTAHYLGRGLAKDPARAVHWFREAAKGGDVGAMYLLASMYEQGDGVERDLRLARHWYAVAAGSGDEAAPLKVMELDALLAVVPR